MVPRKSLEDRLTLQAKIDAMPIELVKKQFQVLLEDCESDDFDIRKLCERVLSQDEIYGNEYGVPSNVDLVEMLISEIIKLKNG